MKRILLFVMCLFLSTLFPCAFAGGGITHMFIAHETIARLPDATLRGLLLDNLDAYLVGAYYPDSGYVKGTHYGEDSHWDPFIYTFADYIKEKYNDPITQDPKLVAFLFGCAAHRVSDEIIHFTFYPVVGDHDFNGDKKKAHAYGDLGIDLLLNMDKNQWTNEPTTWWIPLIDLLQVYHRMGKDEYTADEITWGNSVISVAGDGERMISAPSYPYLKWKMPWTGAHYYDWPEGGILMDEQKVADYLMNLWHRLQDRKEKAPVALTVSREDKHVPDMAIQDIAIRALLSGDVTVSATTNKDGSVILQHPTIHNIEQFTFLLNQLRGNMTR